MDHSPAYHDRGTRFTNYSSIHSADAFVGEYQVMYTPGNSPKEERANKKSTRFSRNTSASVKSPYQNLSQSYLLPVNMPNTSQIMPDHGSLLKMHVNQNIPADEKQIVASLRALQRDLNEAMQTIQSLTRERDEAVRNLQLMQAHVIHGTRKPSSPPKKQARNIEDELFDLSSPIQDSPRPRHPQSKKESQTQVSDEARVLTVPSVTVPRSQENEARQRHGTARIADIKTRDASVKQYEKPTVMEETEQSMLAGEKNITGLSNTSRRRLNRQPSYEDDNMTSAYILQDITVEDNHKSAIRVSKAAQNVLHSLDPEHINDCEVCHRLVMHVRAEQKRPSRSDMSARRQSAPHQMVSLNESASPKLSAEQMIEPPSCVQDFASRGPSAPMPATSHRASRAQSQPDYTAAIAGFKENDYTGNTTMRPKIDPALALQNVKTLMNAQFEKAKERHATSCNKYNSIPAPMSSRKHAEISKEMMHWAEKMEECRVHLDYLRDVEEGMAH